MNDIENLLVLLGDTVKKRQLETDLSKALEKEKELMRCVTDHRKSFEKEHKDVERLENNAVVKAFYAVTGNLDDKREKERSEAKNAKELYDQAERELESATKSIDKMTRKLHALRNCEEDFTALKKKILEGLKDSDEKLYDDASGLYNDSERLGKDIASIDGLNSVGSAIIEITDDLLETLELAKKGRYKGRYTEGAYIVRHATLYSGKDVLEELRSLLERFHSSVVDLPKIGRLDSIEDIVYGRFYGDGFSAIENGLTELKNLKNSINSTKTKLLYTREQKVLLKEKYDKQFVQLFALQ